MMAAVSNAVHCLFGKPPGERLVLALFSARFDETGTDGQHDHAILAGGVSRVEGWGHLEARWDRLMINRKVRLFHARDFNAGDGDFADWGRAKRSRLIKSMEKVIRDTVSFEVAVAVDRAEHTEIKRKMKGVRGFYADSDIGLCFRMALFLACQKVKEIDGGGRLQVIVEDGPFSSNMHDVYQRIKKSHGAKYKPAMFAGMLAGFASVPKGELRSLEAADFLADRAIDDLRRGRFTKPGRPHRISAIAGPQFLDWWHQGMLQERERRTAFGRRPKTSPARGDGPAE